MNNFEHLSLRTNMTLLPWFFFFFEAEEGIRDSSVTGVQTCALRIFFHRGMRTRQAGCSGGPVRITRFEQVRRYTQLGESAFLDEKWQNAQQFIRTHPGLTLQLFGRRIVATWLGTESPQRDFLHPGSPLVAFIFAWNVFVLVGVVAALARLLILRSPFFVPIPACPLVFSLVYYLTQTSLRLRHPCDPVLALMVVLALPIFPLKAVLSIGPAVSPLAGRAGEAS